MPFQTPVRVKRRRTPPKPDSALRISASEMPRSCATANCGRALSAIVAPRHRQHQVFDGVDIVAGAVAKRDRENANCPFACSSPIRRTSAAGFPVRHDAAILEAADHGLHHLMVGAHHREAIEGNILNEGLEGGLHRIEGLEVIEVLGIHIGDDGDVGPAASGRCRRFVRLDHHPVAGAEARIGAIGVDDAALMTVGSSWPRRAASPPAMWWWSCRGAGDGDAAFKPHQLGQHLGAPHQPAGASCAPQRVPDCRV